jgi:tetratricopeptide (TPR) repeat protein
MNRQHLHAWLSRMYRRRGLLLALLLPLGMAAFGAPWLWAWNQLRQGRDDLRRYHPEQARRHLAACLRLWPRDVAAHLLAARAARQLGAYDEAEEHLRQAQREQREQSEDVVLEWALHRATLGDLARSETYLLSLTREDSERSSLACEALFEGCRRNYRIPQALSVLEMWLGRQPDNVRALLLRGHLWGQLNVYRRAVPDYQRVLELDPEQAEARHWLSVCLVENMRWHEAQPYLEEMHRQHPADVEVSVLLARCWNHQGQQQQAQQLLQSALAERPDDHLALRSLGETFLQEQEPVRAETYLRRAIDLVPHDKTAHWFLYQSLRQQDKTAEAEEQLDRTEQLENRWKRFHEITQHDLAARPNDVGLQAELGGLMLDLGLKDAGHSWLLVAVQRDPQCRLAHEALARYYRQQGDDELAARHRRLARAGTEPANGTAGARRP